MTAFEITLICILSFMAFLSLCFTLAGVKLFVKLSALVHKFEHKVHHAHHCCEHEHECEEATSGSRTLDVLAHLASVAMTGMEMWKNRRKRRW